MDRLRAFAKTLLADTFIYDFAKSSYNAYKIRQDSKLFLKRYPNAQYVHYSKAQLLEQRAQGYRSQYGQDYYLWNAFFSEHNKGSFIDIGANQPVANSNSYFLEQHGWTGLAIDPLKKFSTDWKDLRTTPLICGAVSDTEGEETFVEISPKQGWEHALSGFKQYVRPEDLQLYEHKEYQVKTNHLTHYVADTECIDVVFIDVEGAELKVLRGIDFSTISPQYLLVENDKVFGGGQEIREFLKNKGYDCVARISATDDLYLKRLQ